MRIWPPTDPDDCFAIALLAHASNLQIVGISTVFGNAPREVVDRTTIELAARLWAEVGRTLPVYSGSAAPLAQDGSSPQPPAHEALLASLEQGPLIVVALGPLTNLAAVLGERPALRSQVARLVAVMGRRAGHIFHPAEGADAGMLFGHGPVFRDFNFVMDVRASSQIVALNLPTSLIPYDAARGIEITAGDLDRLTASGGTMSWVAERARPWKATGTRTSDAKVSIRLTCSPPPMWSNRISSGARRCRHGSAKTLRYSSHFGGQRRC